MKTKTTFWLMLAAAFCAQAVFTVAWAFDASPALPADDAAAWGLFQTIWDFMVTKRYAAAVGPVLTLLVWMLKKWDVKIPKVGVAIDKFLDKPFVSFLLPTVAAALGGFIVSLATGHSFVDAMGAVFATSSSAITTYVGLQKLDEQGAAGEKEAEKVVDKKTAVEELKKP